MIDRRAVIVGLAALCLAGCGRKGRLDAPPDRDLNFPRHYPAPKSPPPDSPSEDADNPPPPTDPSTPMWQR